MFQKRHKIYTIRLLKKKKKSLYISENRPRTEVRNNRGKVTLEFNQKRSVNIWLVLQETIQKKQLT